MFKDIKGQAAGWTVLAQLAFTYAPGTDMTTVTANLGSFDLASGGSPTQVEFVAGVSGATYLVDGDQDVGFYYEVLPEPASVGLLSLGLAGLAMRRAKRRRCQCGDRRNRR
jgi:hypothetical protein